MKSSSLPVRLALLFGAVFALEDVKSTIAVFGNLGNYKLDPSVQHIPVDPNDQRLRPPPAMIPATFLIHIGSSVFRDGVRCGKTIFTALKRAVKPDRFRFGIVEQLLDTDPKCLDEYCKLAAIEWPQDTECRYKNFIQVNPRPAAEASGCTTARHLQQQMIQDEEFCLQVDGHSIFTNGWDEIMLNEWKRIDNEMAILSVYPHDLHDFVKENGDNNAPDWIPHLCTIVKGGNGLARIGSASIIHGSKFPQLSALWGGGLSFGKCHAERNVPIDSHTPWLWDGEEFVRAANFWTHGYDIYSPSRLGTVMYHNYSAKPANFWKSSVDPAVKALNTERSHNRVRLQLGIDFKGQVDASELDKYQFGSARSLHEFFQFAKVRLDGFMNETNSCQQLHWVPYSNATVVEAIVANGWKMKTLDPAVYDHDIAKAPQAQQGNRQKAAVDEVAPSQDMTETGAGEAEVVVTPLDVGTERNDGGGNDRPIMRHVQPESGRPVETFGFMAWGFLAVVLAVLFVMLSNDRISHAIRQNFVSPQHRSRD
ncbi:hypothetical protein CCR75_000026 [Bremia lactucae]|uniref:Uncharacterized protein n=1 Tax=Bremia lactucae TaxID=4779 RepID=A0A976ILM1_BRELC|nr:hypothetical protein CCR75_000026 [Bremia lactucae]